MSKSFESIEIISYEKARKIYDNWENIPFTNLKRLSLGNEKKKLKEYLLKAISTEKKGKIPVTYSYVRGRKGTSRQSVSGVGLQNLMREVRQTISNDYYYDIDMVNSEPVLLLNYCIKLNYPHDAIAYYCANRDDCLKSLMDKFKISKSEAKLAVISVINGGSSKYSIKWFNEFGKDIKEIHTRIAKSPAYSLRLERIKEHKPVNPIGTLVCEIFHEIENECLIKCLDFLKEEDISIRHVVLVFDGFMIPKDDIEISDSLFERMASYVNKKTGYEVKYIRKDMNETIDVSSFKFDKKNELVKQVITADSDKEASEILLSELDGQVFFCNGQIWLRTQAERIYVCDETQVTNELINRCMNLGIERKTGTKKIYSANISTARNIVASAMNAIKTSIQYRDEDFVDRMISFTKDKIFFRNGYISVGSSIKSIIEDDYEDYEIITPVRISRDIPDLDNISTETHEEFMSRILMPIFGTKELLNNYLQHIARAITGHIEDKDWLIMSGMRNCGKGIITTLNNYTFGIYSNETSANSFLMERQHTVEDPKKYAWLYQNRWTRLLHTSEVKFDLKDTTIKIDGNLIKNKLSSGGDIIEVRDLYQSAIKIKPQCRLMMMCNDIPPISPPDAVQTLSKFTFPSQFVESDMYETMKSENNLSNNIKHADITTKDYVKRNDVCDCYLSLVLNAFANQKVKNCSKLVEDTRDLKADLGDESSLITKYFKFTGSKNDQILSNELITFHNKNYLNISISKLKDILKFHGAVENKNLSDDINVRGSKRGYIGVSLIDINED